ncbi:MAG: hypothetical protein ACI9K2_006760 [Myxococcota bacterium]|jgi:hypothetical protein
MSAPFVVLEEARGSTPTTAAALGESPRPRGATGTQPASFAPS